MSDPTPTQTKTQTQTPITTPTTTTEYAAAVAAATSLDELLVALRLLDRVADDDRDEADRVVDWSALPSYGGDAPDHTDGVWSWDETRQIVGTYPDDLRIEPRPESVPIEYRVIWDSEGGYDDLPDAHDLDSAKDAASEIPGLEWNLDRAVESRIPATVQGRRGRNVVEERSIEVVVPPDHGRLIRDAMTCGGWLVGCGDDPDDHDWESTYEIEGGVRENPGVWSGGGTTMHYAAHCAVCGLRRRETLYGAQRDPGQVDRVRYSAPVAEGDGR